MVNSDRIEDVISILEKNHIKLEDESNNLDLEVKKAGKKKKRQLQNLQKRKKLQKKSLKKKKKLQKARKR